MLDFIVNIVFGFFFACILGRTILAYIVPMSGGRPNPIIMSAQRFVFQVTEPILGPIRRYLTFGVFDFSPMVVMIVLVVVWKRLV